MKSSRDYAHEHQLRLKKRARLVADLERKKVMDFKELLEARGVTFNKWLDNKISEEMNRAD